VQVHAFKANGDIHVVDRYDILKSFRRDVDGDLAPIRPGAYREDWFALMKVINAEYPIEGRDCRLKMKFVMCDSGGAEGTTANALQFVRWLRKGGDEAENNLTGWSPDAKHRFHLLRGSTSLTAPRVQISYPDTPRKDRFSGARGDVPVAVLNVNLLKDQLDGILDRKHEGGRISFPDGLPLAFFKELTAEARNPRTQRWENPQGLRNESWDLLVYALAMRVFPGLNLEVVNPDNPPSWMEIENPDNPFVVCGDGEEEEKEETSKPLEKKLEDLGSLLA
jgi:phage terminase large subunit GpA-like protein